MRTYTHMIVSKITGIVSSRHSSYELALKAFKKENSDYTPLEITTYSEVVYKEMR